MADELLILRDQFGRDHHARIDGDTVVTVGDRHLTVQTAADGSVLVSGTDRELLWTAVVGDVRWVFVAGEVYTFELQRPAGFRRRAATHHASLTAPMPATVRKVVVSDGDAVRKGDVLIVLEAMKMELPIRALSDGRVEKVNCREGDLVQPGTSLIELED